MHPSQQAQVERAKQDLLTAGVDISGPCGAWRITNLAAWRLQQIGDAAGLLSKPDGNNCAGYAVDIIAYPDGAIYDVLIASGDLNGPAWQEVGVVDLARWRPAVFPAYYVEAPAPPDPPDPEPPPSSVDARIAALEERLDEIDDWIAQAPRGEDGDHTV
jgi:hypothetical protein